MPDVPGVGAVAGSLRPLPQAVEAVIRMDARNADERVPNWYITYSIIEEPAGTARGFPPGADDESGDGARSIPRPELCSGALAPTAVYLKLSTEDAVEEKGRAGMLHAVRGRPSGRFRVPAALILKERAGEHCHIINSIPGAIIGPA